VNITFIESETFGGSQFPTSKMDRAFVSESGPTYAAGPQARGKRIVEFQLDASGNVLDGPTTFVEYVGTGRATVVGLTAGPDGLYFTDLYKDLDATSPIDPGARVYRVRYTAGGDADFDLDGDVDGVDFLAWQIGFGLNGTASRSDGDADNDANVDAADLDIWEQEYGLAEPAAALVTLATGGSEPVEHPPLSAALLSRPAPVAEPSLASSDLIDLALAVVLAEESDGFSGNQEFVAHLPPLEFFSAKPIGRSYMQSASSFSSPANTSATNTQESESPNWPSPWEDAFDEVFASVF
jgi:hypothetical protein